MHKDKVDAYKLSTFDHIVLFNVIKQLYLQPNVTPVCQDQRPQHLESQIEAISFFIYLWQTA